MGYTPFGPDVTSKLRGGGVAFITLIPPKYPAEMFALHDRVWQQAGAPDGCLCVGCVEKRIRRRLKRPISRCAIPSIALVHM